MVSLTALFFILLSTLSFRYASATVGDVHCARYVAAPTLPQSFVSFGDEQGKLIADYILKEVLKDDPINVYEPVQGKTYAYMAYPQSQFAFWENWCNGGKHAYLVLATWDDSQDDEDNRFLAVQYDLIVLNNNEEPGYEGQQPVPCTKEMYWQIASWQVEDVWDSAERQWTKPNRYTFQALGQVGYDKPPGEIYAMLETAANEYFQENNVYSYLGRNCGAFVQMLANVLDLEYGIPVVACAPPM